MPPIEPSEYRIELAHPNCFERLQDIERAAGRLFEAYAIPESVMQWVTPLDEFAEAQRDGTLWVAKTVDNVIVGFALVAIVDGNSHLEEIDVHPDHGRRGIGAALIQTVCDWARSQGHAHVTLTTFRDIPWNEPFYRRIGFAELPPAQWGPQLQLVVDDETEHGLDPSTRLVMRYGLGAV